MPDFWHSLMQSWYSRTVLWTAKEGKKKNLSPKEITVTNNLYLDCISCWQIILSNIEAFFHGALNMKTAQEAQFIFFYKKSMLRRHKRLQKGI